MRVIAPGDFGVVTVGSLHAGTRDNVIGDRAVLELNVRAHSPEIRQKLLASIEQIVRAECPASSSPKEPTFEYHAVFPPTNNDAELTGRVHAALGTEHVETMPPATGSEDFSRIPDAFGVPTASGPGAVPAGAAADCQPPSQVRARHHPTLEMGTSESKAEQTATTRFDIVGLLVFMITGALLSNFAVNMTIGMLIVSQQMLQLARPERFDAWHAGLLTLGFAIAVISCIRIGEKLLQRFGPRKPMMWGAMILGLCALLLMQTQVLVGTYVVLAVIAYVLFGLGLAFYATPSTDAALSNLPPAQSGAGAGIYKMASSLVAAIGAAASLAIFTGVMGSGFTTGWIFEMQGIQSNARVRTAGMLTMGFNLRLTLLALLSVALTVPKGRKEG